MSKYDPERGYDGKNVAYNLHLKVFLPDYYYRCPSLYVWHKDLPLKYNNCFHSVDSWIQINQSSFLKWMLLLPEG